MAGTVVSQPDWPAVMKPAVSPASAAAPSSSPGTSVRRCGFFGDSVAYRRSMTTVSRQIGTLTRKMERALEEQRNGEWRYLEFLQVTSLITVGIHA